MTPSDADDERSPETDAADEAARREAEAWAQIVENYGEHPSFDDAGPSGAAAHDTDPTDGSRPPSAPHPSGPPPSGLVRPAPSRSDDLHDRAQDPPAAGGGGTVEEPASDEDHYVPPPAPRVPLAPPPRLLAWLGLFGVPLLTLVAVVAGVSLPQWLSVLFMAWFVGGFAFLVASMRPGPRDDHDDGAVV